MSQLIVENIHKSYGEIHALTRVSFEATQGEIIAILGPSGCGKSTLLSIIAGLERPDYGRVTWSGSDLEGKATHERGFGLMFQDYALFPHKNVRENIGFGLQMAKRSKVEIETVVEEIMELIGMQGFGDRDVNLLSGGEQQRVALARTLAPKPKLLMLDEPLGSLDRTLRDNLLQDMRSILEDEERVTLYVTHDQEEAFSIADRIVLLNEGKVAQIGTPKEIHKQPSSLFVAEFLGMDNLLTGQVRMKNGDYLADTDIGELPIPETPEKSLIILLRPDAMRLDSSGEKTLEGQVLHTDFRGSTTQLDIEIAGKTLRFDFLSSLPLPEIGDSVLLSYHPHEAIQILTDLVIS